MASKHPQGLEWTSNEISALILQSNMSSIFFIIPMLQFKNSIYFLIYFNQLYGNYNWTLYLSDILDDDIEIFESKLKT